MTCCCPEHIAQRAAGAKHVSCIYSGLKIHEAWPFIERTCQERKDNARMLTPADTENDQQLMRSIRSMLLQVNSKAKQRFKFHKEAPWSFARSDTVSGSVTFMTQVQAHPLEDHDDLTRHCIYIVAHDHGPCSRR